MSPTAQYDDNFWDWYETIGPSWLLSHRLDILNTMYAAYQDTIRVDVDENVTYVALKSEMAEAMLDFFTAPTPPPVKKKITDSEINNFKKKLKHIRIRWEDDK